MQVGREPREVLFAVRRVPGARLLVSACRAAPRASACTMIGVKDSKGSFVRRRSARRQGQAGGCEGSKSPGDGQRAGRRGLGGASHLQGKSLASEHTLASAAGGSAAKRSHIAATNSGGAFSYGGGAALGGAAGRRRKARASAAARARAAGVGNSALRRTDQSPDCTHAARSGASAGRCATGRLSW